MTVYEMKTVENGGGGTAGAAEDPQIQKATGNSVYWFTFGVIFLIVVAAVTSICVVFLVDNGSESGGDFVPIVQPSAEPEVTTMAPEDICSLAIDQGSNCGSGGSGDRWGFEEDSCVKFSYGGCEGNNNQFMSEDDCQSFCGDAGGLPKTVTQLQDTPFDTLDVRSIFGTSDTILQVAPPSDRVGDLRSEGALPTGHFACNQINHGPLSPIRQFPHSLVMDNIGVTYEAYTFDRWTDPKRQDPMYGFTPGKAGTPWEKIPELGQEMKQTNSAPDSTPFSTFTGQSGIRVAIEGNTADPVMTDFEEMYADFLYTDPSGGTMELPLVRGSGFLTHIFNGATPVLTPYCLRAINGQAATFECPEEETLEYSGEGFVEAVCDSTTETATLTVHHTKPIKELTDVQFAVRETTEWVSDNGGFQTCDDTCCTLSADGLTTTISLQGANSSINYGVNVIGKYVVPQHEYGTNNYWYGRPAVVPCTSTNTVTLTKGGRMPVWFYEDASIDATRCIPKLGSSSVNTVTVTLKLDMVANILEEVQYKIAEDWANAPAWTTCDSTKCQLLNGGAMVEITIDVDYESVFFAANVIGQFVTEAVPFNYRRQPEKIYCPGASPDPAPPPITITSNEFVFELNEPIDDGGPDSTRKYVVFFSENMDMTFDQNGAKFSPSRPFVEKFTGVMQLAYAGSGSVGDMQWVNELKKYAGVYSYKPKTRFGTEGDMGYISFDWNKVGEDFLGTNPNLDLLTVALPHHEELLGDGLIDSPFGFKGFVGDYWVMEEPLPPAPMEPNQDAVERIKRSPERLADMLAAIATDSAQHTLDTDCIIHHSYEAGKSIGLVTRLASISRAFGTEHYVELDQSLRNCLDLWLGIVGGIIEDNVIRYDTVWGGLWMRGAADGEELFPWTNYGFISYADHHFHFGYWMYAIAYYATHNPAWAFKEDNYNRIMAMARDVGSPSKKDTQFPTVRQKDWYLGSSWATGIGGGARQEESASEAVNCYHALAALGHAMNDPVLMATGQITLATELRSVRWYWTVRENNRHIFPSIIQEQGVVGQVAEDGIFYYTINWQCHPDQYPQRHACIVGIQIIPIVSISYLYMDKEWADNVYDVCNYACDPLNAPRASEVDLNLHSMVPVTPRFSAFCQAIMAKVDAEKQQAAAEFVRGLQTTALEPGTGVASTLLFIYEST